MKAMGILEAMHLALLLLPVSSTALKMHAYRSDGKLPEERFLKLCFEKYPGYNIRLVQGESCGEGYDDEWTVKNTVFRQTTYRSPATYSSVEKHLKQDASWTAEKLSAGSGRNAIWSETQSLVAKSKGNPSFEWEEPRKDSFGQLSSWSKAVLSRTKEDTNMFDFNSNVEFGTIFEDFSMTLRKWKGLRAPVDFSLDALRITEQENLWTKFQLVACQVQSSNHDEPSSESSVNMELWLHSNYKPHIADRSGRCFPVRLTQSEGLMHHTRDLWVQRLNILYEFQLDAMPFNDAPAYDDNSPYDVRDVEGSINEYSVYKKDYPDKDLLIFKGFFV